MCFGTERWGRPWEPVANAPLQMREALQLCCQMCEVTPCQVQFAPNRCEGGLAAGAAAGQGPWARTSMWEVLVADTTTGGSESAARNCGGRQGAP